MRNFIPVALNCDPAVEPAFLEGRTCVSRLLSGLSLEATPRQLELADRLDTRLPQGTSVYVPFLPGADLADTVLASAALVKQGLRPVPHLAARAIASRDSLSKHLSNLADSGVDSVLLIAGDLRRPTGPFGSTLGILDSGLLERYNINRIGVAGHPEGHPVVDGAAVAHALERKAEYAAATGCSMWIVTQFAFSAEPVLDWLERIRGAGITLPVRVGVPGPAKPQTLLRYAAQCGIGASSRMLARRPCALTRLLGRWTPDDMLTALASRAAERASPFEGIHIFPFGGLLQSIDHLSTLRDEH